MCNSPVEENFPHESDEDFDYYNDDEPDLYIEREKSIADKSNVEAFIYKELEANEVETLLSQEVDSLCHAIEVPHSIARSLLLSYEWDVEHVKTIFRSDPIRLLIVHCLLPSCTANPTISDSYDVMAVLRTIERLGFRVEPYLRPDIVYPDSSCSICLSPPSPSAPPVDFSRGCEPRLSSIGEIYLRVSETPERSGNLYGLSCGHRFCADCWSCYLSTQVSEGLSVEIKCMAVCCDVSVPEDFLLSLLKDSQLRDKYTNFVFHKMVNSHPLLRFCVGANCPIVINALEPAKARRVTCSRCNSQFCFTCGEPYHAPTSCLTMKRWLVKCRDDSSTATYMAAHTKDCPACHVCIEKNGGCNHMQCTHCNYEFCWVCLDAWSTHYSQYYTCSRYLKNSDPTRDQARQQAREALKRYVFYYDRWANHERSLKLEQQHLATVRARIQEKVLNKDGTWIDWQYLLTAADTLRKCRYTLQYTYPMAYYSDKLANKELFEYMQALLESEVEELAWKIEHAQITDRADLQNAMDVCEKHRLTLLHEFISD